MARGVDDPLLVKQFAGGAAEELWLDWSYERRRQREETATLACSRLGNSPPNVRRSRYGLRLPGRELTPNQGKAHRDACLEALALYCEKVP